MEDPLTTKRKRKGRTRKKRKEKQREARKSNGEPRGKEDSPTTAVTSERPSDHGGDE